MPLRRAQTGASRHAGLSFARMKLPLQDSVETALVLAQRGVLRPVRPDRLVRMALAFRHWGTSIASAYAVNAVSRADQAALIDDERSLTYAEVDARTNAYANELVSLGLGAGDKLAVLCRNGSELVES